MVVCNPWREVRGKPIWHDIPLADIKDNEPAGTCHPSWPLSKVANSI